MRYGVNGTFVAGHPETKLFSPRNQAMLERRGERSQDYEVKQMQSSRYLRFRVCTSALDAMWTSFIRAKIECECAPQVHLRARFEHRTLGPEQHDAANPAVEDDAPGVSAFFSKATCAFADANV